jgi:mono/diheme cytochrome c family protein
MGKRSDDDIRNVIKSGGPAISKSALMPPWGATISDAQIELLLGYVRKFAK